MTDRSAVSPVVLTVGSLHHDIMIEADHLPVRDETAVGHRWYPKFGGKGGNQAVAVARAGVRSRMIGATGRDDFGRFLLAVLDSAGVDRRHVSELPDCGSGISVAIQDALGDYAATIVSGANLRLDSAVLNSETVWQDVKLLILQNEIPEAVNLAAADMARHKGIPVLLNAAPARPIPDLLRGTVDVLVVNAVEAQMMGAGPVTDLGTALAAARQLAVGYASVIVTAGAHGLALCASGELRLKLPAIPVVAQSTHGAGDSFVGTLAARLATGMTLPAACSEAAAAAARHVAGSA